MVSSGVDAYPAAVERGDECGFEHRLGGATTARLAIVDGAAELVGLLTDATYYLHTRRQPETWSPLEYECHLRDVAAGPAGARARRPPPPANLV